MNEIPILMHPLLDSEWKRRIDESPDADPFPESDWVTGFGVNAKSLLSGILSELGLGRRDEVVIFTTSDSTYVSTCVSVTAFNHCRISRELSEETKVAIVIHEFGFLYPEYQKVIPELKQRGIFVIEDCAHAIGLDERGRGPGRLGHCALYSLPKIFPMLSGGMIRSKEPRFRFVGRKGRDDARVDQIEKEATQFIPKFAFFSRRRLENYNALSSISHLRFYEPGEFFCPYFAGLRTPESCDLCSKFKTVEWGATFRDDLVYWPTNPLIEESVFRNTGKLVEQYLLDQ